MKEGETAGGGGGGGKEAGRERQRVDKETEKERQKAAREAEKERQRLEKEAEKDRQRQEKEAEKERLRQEREAEKERQRQEKEAEKERQRQEKDAERERQRQEREAERERQRQEKEAEKEKQRLEREREKSLKDAEKERQRQEKEMKKLQEEAEKEQKRFEKEAEEKRRAMALKKQASIMDRFLVKPLSLTGITSATTVGVGGGDGGPGSSSRLSTGAEINGGDGSGIIAERAGGAPFLLLSRINAAGGGENKRDTLFLPPTVSPDTVAMATVAKGAPATSAMDSELGQAREGEVDFGVLSGRHLSIWRWAGRDQRRRRPDRWGKRRRPKSSAPWGLPKVGTIGARVARNAPSSVAAAVVKGWGKGSRVPGESSTEGFGANMAPPNADRDGVACHTSRDGVPEKQENGGDGEDRAAAAAACGEGGAAALIGDGAGLDRVRTVKQEDETTSYLGEQSHPGKSESRRKRLGNDEEAMEELGGGFKQLAAGGEVLRGKNEDDDRAGNHRHSLESGEEEEEEVEAAVGAFVDEHVEQQRQHVEDDDSREGGGGGSMMRVLDEERGRAPKRRKLLQFHDNYRPAYYGTFSKRSDVIGPRHPFKQDPSLDYEADSDAEWQEEEPGESLSDLDGKDHDDDEEKAGVVGLPEEDEDSADGFVVPDGYLSEGEGAGAGEDDGTSTEDVAMTSEDRMMMTSREKTAAADGAQQNEAEVEVELAKWRAMEKSRRLLAMATERALRTNCPLIVSRLLPPLPASPPPPPPQSPHAPSQVPSAAPTTAVESCLQNGREGKGRRSLAGTPLGGRTTDKDGKAAMSSCSIPEGASAVPAITRGASRVSGGVPGTTSNKLDDAILRGMSVMVLEGDLVVETPCPSGHDVINGEICGGGDEDVRHVSGRRRLGVGGTGGGKGSGAGNRHAAFKKETLSQAGGGGGGASFSGAAAAAGPNPCNLPTSPASTANGESVAGGSGSKPPPGRRVTPITKFFTKISSAAAAAVAASSPPSPSCLSQANQNSPSSKPPLHSSIPTTPATDRNNITLALAATGGVGGRPPPTGTRTKTTPTTIRKAQESNGADLAGCCLPSSHSPSLPSRCVLGGDLETAAGSKQQVDRTGRAGAAAEGCENGGVRGECGAETVVGKEGDAERGERACGDASGGYRHGGRQFSADCHGARDGGKTKGCKRKL